MKWNTILATLTTGLMLSALALLGCNDKQNIPAEPNTSDDATLSVPQDVLNEITELRRLAALPDRGIEEMANDGTLDKRRRTVYVPAGSVNALAAAIAEAGNNGTVVLRTGVHTENSTVTVTSKVSILGQRNAVLKSASTYSNAIPQPVQPAIHVLNARGVTISNIDFRSVSGVANTAILLDHARKSVVLCNTFEGYQLSILSHYANSSTMLGNRVLASQGGDVVESDGIININGDNVRIVDNEISNGLLNVFCSGSGGFLIDNKMDAGFVGMILCKVPAGSFLLPGGEIIGSDISGKEWYLYGNRANNNAYAGFLVIDGANNNLLVNNRGSGNGAYDMELLGETCLFGFSTPTSFNNKVVVGPYRNITINDFGQNNRVIGAQNLTHNITVPCN